MRNAVSTQDLRIGMFVADLDRSWLGTPFVLEGFLIKSPDDINTLRKYCQFVHIDHSRSTGEHYKTQSQWRPEQHRARVTEMPKTPALQRDFHKVLLALQKQEKNHRNVKSGWLNFAAARYPNFSPTINKVMLKKSFSIPRRSSRNSATH